MISRVIRLLLLSIVATVGSFSYAEIEYQPKSIQRKWIANGTTCTGTAGQCCPSMPAYVTYSWGYEITKSWVPFSEDQCAGDSPLPNGALPKLSYWGFVNDCPYGFQPTPGSPPPDQACYKDEPAPPPDPCEDEEGQEFTAPYYLGDVSSSGDASGTTSPPQYLCIAQCRAVMTNSGDCYSRAYLASSGKFGKSAVFCEATYTVINQTCTASDDPSNPPPPDSPTDPDNPDTPLPSKPTPAPMGGMDGESGNSDDSEAPAKDPNTPSCAPGTYAVQTGNTFVCNSIDNPHPKPDDEGCPAGSQVGTVNGVPTCMKGGSSKPSSNSPGSGTAGATGADGAGGNNGNPSAGTVGATADTGGPVGGSASSPTKGAGQTEIGVLCDVEPVCDGDPLLCGIQKQQWKSGCEIQKAIATPLDEEELDRWNAIAATGGELHQVQEETQGRVVQALQSFSSRLGFSTSGCPSDFSIDVMGRSIQIALSEACTLLRVLKMLIFMSAYIFSLRIIWSSIL